MSHHRLYKIWSQVPPTYYQHGVKRNILQRIWHQNKIKNATNIMQHLSFTRCLDVGCASGFMVSEIAKKFPQGVYYGLDAYDGSIACAKKQYPHIAFKVGNAEKIPYKDHFFDLLVCYETIEHIEYPARALKEMKRVLRKNGTLILAMDSGNWAFRGIWYVWEHTFGRAWFGAHLHPFHHSELEQLIKRSGFKIKSKRFTHCGLEVVFVLGK